MSDGFGRTSHVKIILQFLGALLHGLAVKYAGGVPLCLLSSGEGGFGWSRLVEGAVAEHGVEDVGSASGEGDEGLVVTLALGDLPVVVGA